MKEGVKSLEEHIEEAHVAADMAWWELEFPSGALSFSKNKTDMLGYDKEDFVHLAHFTDLIHPKDYEKTMKAMKDHYEGRLDCYETKYRIKAKNGKYVLFHDKGKIVERSDSGIIVAGIVRKVSDDESSL